MTVEIPPHAPGCFGSALAYQSHHAFCGACVFKDLCEPLHLQNLAALRAELGVTVVAKPKKVKPVSTDPADLLPKKVRDLVDQLDAGNFRVTESLSNGINPFRERFAFLQIACHLLLNMSRPITRDLLKAAYLKRLDWKEDTAEAHSRMTFQALKHIGAVDLVDNGMVLRRLSVG